MMRKENFFHDIQEKDSSKFFGCQFLKFPFDWNLPNSFVCAWFFVLIFFFFDRWNLSNYWGTFLVFEPGTSYIPLITKNNISRLMSQPVGEVDRLGHRHALLHNILLSFDTAVGSSLLIVLGKERHEEDMVPPFKKKSILMIKNSFFFFF